MPGSSAGGSTQRYAVLGFPVRHSLSPRMHLAAFRALGMDATYEAIEVPSEALEAELARLHREGYAGLNVTLPLKEHAAALVERRTEEASEAGAVNTLRRERDGWEGHATDGLGFESWADEAGVTIRGARVLVLGAGGAARSTAPNLVRLGPAAVHVVSRSGDRARELAERMHGLSDGTLAVRASALADAPEDDGWSVLVRLLAPTDVLSDEGRWWDRLVAGAAVLEGNYAERAAGARARAASSGLRFEDGLRLLLHQGARSFTFWTGREAPVEAMREAIRETG